MPDHDPHAHRPHVKEERPHEDHRRERDCPGDEIEQDEGEMSTLDSGGHGGDQPPPPPGTKTPPAPSGQ